MAVVDIIEFLLMALEVTGKFKGKNFHLQKKDESFTWRSSYSWSYVYFLQCMEDKSAEIIQGRIQTMMDDKDEKVELKIKKFNKSEDVIP